LALSTAVNSPDPRNVIHIVEDGIRPPQASSARGMPPSGRGLNNEDMTMLVEFVRAHFSSEPAWPDVAARVIETRAKHP
jgi:hypothetical protein